MNIPANQLLTNRAATLDGTFALFNQADQLRELALNPGNLSVFELHEKEKQIQLDMAQNEFNVKMNEAMEEANEKRSDKYFADLKKNLLHMFS